MTSYLRNSVAQAAPIIQKDHRIWWLIVASILGMALYFVYDPQVFPSASIDLKLSRGAIAKIAQDWAYELGYQKKQPIQSTRFSADYEGKTFLEYELGSSRANELMKEELPIWSWRTRFCKEHEFEEFRAWVSTGGKLYGFVHEIENDRVLPSLSKKDAELLARQFIENRAGISLAEYKMVKSSSFSQPHRVDHSFTWQDRQKEFNGARLRVQATVSGNILTQYSNFLYVPETWERKFSTIRSYNHLLGSIASIFYSIIQYVSVFVFIWAVTSNQLRWRFSVVAALIVTSVSALDSFNNIASVIDEYNTHDIFYGYLLQFVFQTLNGTLSQFLSSLVLIGAAEAIYRHAYPHKIAMENFFSLSGLRNRTVAVCMLLGYVLVGIDLGWVILYYLGGEQLHFWCPLGVDNYQILSTIFPFFSAVTIGVSASLSEELMYRVIALSVVQRLTRNFWFANLFQAVAWGFMHSTYPQQPAYARGVELTIGGLFHGWILRRFGVLPSLISHYLFDAFLDVKPLFSSTDIWLRASALLPVLPLLIAGLWIMHKIRKTGSVDESVLENSAVPVLKRNETADPGVIAEESGRFEYNSLSPKMRIMLCVLGLASLALTSPLRGQVAIGSESHVALSRAEVFTKAKQCLQEHNVSWQGKKSVVFLTNPIANDELQYVYEQVKLKKTLELAKIAKRNYIWKVRFFRPLDPQEYEVSIDQTGKTVAFTTVRAEDAPGARLTVEAARKKAEDYLAASHSNFWPYQFDSVTENQRKERTDYTFYYKVPNLKVGEADFKLSTAVVGDVVSGFDSGWEVPDNWLNERNKKRTKDEIFLYLRYALNLVMFLAVLRWAFGVLKSGYITWRNALKCAIGFFVLFVLQDLNNLVVFFRGYHTTQPLTAFYVREIVSDLEADFATLAFYTVGLAFGLAALRMFAPNFKLGSYMQFLFRPGDAEAKRERRELWIDAVLLTFAVVSTNALITAASSYVKALISPQVPLDSPSIICSIANVGFTPFDFLYDALVGGFNALLLSTLFVALYRRFCPNFRIYLVLVGIFVLINLSYHRYWQDYLVDVTSNNALLLLAWFAVARLITLNPLVYFLIGFENVLAARLFSLLEHGLPLFAGQILVLAAGILSPCFYLAFISWYKRHRHGDKKLKGDNQGS